MSMRARLLWLISVILVLTLVPLGIISFARTLHEADELLDGRLVQTARSLALQTQEVSDPARHDARNDTLIVPVYERDDHAAARFGRTYESEVGFQVFDASGHMTIGTANLVALPALAANDEGFHDLKLGDYEWRTFTLRDATGGVAVRVAERHDSRRDIIRALWFDHSLPLLLGLPLMALLVGWAVARGLRPLQALAQTLIARAPGSREPITLAHAPRELVPVLDALNGQLGRLEDAIERERRFSADVAHELRTPLASSMIHLDNAMTSTNKAEADLSLQSARAGLAGLARRVEQLLAMARIEAGTAYERVDVDLVKLTMNVMDELTALISSSRVELSFVCESTTILVQGYEAALNSLLRNLLDNALRHVPAGGHVQLTLATSAHHALIEVVDDGPGIPPERRERVFKRFHREKSSRGDGNGLGLSIVQRAAELHDASIQLLDAPAGRGLCVRVSLPLARQPHDTTH